MWASAVFRNIDVNNTANNNNNTANNSSDNNTDTNNNQELWFHPTATRKKFDEDIFDRGQKKSCSLQFCCLNEFLVFSLKKRKTVKINEKWGRTKNSTPRDPLAEHL